MGQQLIIPNFYRPCHVTLNDVQRYMTTLELPVRYIEPSTRELRLAIDLVKQLNPLFEFHVKEHLDTIRRLCRYSVSDERILRVKPFKEILFKEIIVGVKYSGNGKYEVKLKRVIRRHNKF